MTTDADRIALTYWNSLSGAWRILPPLAPSPDDIQWFERASGCLDGGCASGPEALLLGVTRAIANMRWPRNASLLAVDWSWGMLRNVWAQPPALVSAAALCADWRELPLPAASRDVAVGDGCYTALGSFENSARMNAELRRVLREGGMYCLRCFVRPGRAGPVDELLAELDEGRVSNLDLFRWRLAMAVQGNSRNGVAIGEVWRNWSERVADVRALSERHGWSEADLRKFERWKGAAMRYYFPSLAELQELAAPAFDVLSCDIPTYAFGECFPRIAMRAR